MKAEGSQTTNLKHFPLDGVRKTLAFARQVASEDRKLLENTNLRENAGYAPMHSIADSIEKELSRMEKFNNPPETVKLEAAELERAFEPLMCLHGILLRTGQSTIDVDSDDVASVLGAILHSAYTRIGYPVRGDIL